MDGEPMYERGPRTTQRSKRGQRVGYLKLRSGRIVRHAAPCPHLKSITELNSRIQELTHQLWQNRKSTLILRCEIKMLETEPIQRPANKRRETDQVQRPRLRWLHEPLKGEVR